MRRSRLVFAFIFVVISTTIFTVHKQSPATFRDAYYGKWTPPNFNVPGWMSPSSGGYDQLRKQQDEFRKGLCRYNRTLCAENEEYLEELDLLREEMHATAATSTIESPSETGDPNPTTAQTDSDKPATETPPAAVDNNKQNDPFVDSKDQFQEDLDMPLPAIDLKAYRDIWPHNYHPDSSERFAFAAIMNTRNPSIRDPYFMAIQSLIWRLLWSPRSKSKYPFIAFVAEHVTQEQRDLLAGAGAIVRELPYLDWHPYTDPSDTRPIFGRWRDMFSKLHMWNQTDFSRITFLDADAFPVTHVDDFFTVAPVQKCDKSKLLEDDYFPDGTSACSKGEEGYVFATVPQGSVGDEVELNVGAMVFSPSLKMHARLLQNYKKTFRYNNHMADQGFLSWQFAPDSAFPVNLLSREWNGFFPQQNEKGQLKIVHEKLWASFSEGWLKEEWLDGWREMIEWYESDDFSLMRKEDERYSVTIPNNNEPESKSTFGNLFGGKEEPKTEMKGNLAEIGELAKGTPGD